MRGNWVVSDSEASVYLEAAAEQEFICLQSYDFLNPQWRGREHVRMCMSV